ncbi:MAG TPA: nicotinic acid mononucleotide adenylyltransferase [Nitrospiraceae bacterium]|nr:MAG: nicotinate (nicotinamide) nucleotide adenylyltransferase [Nitrospirae bacterium GWA2_46_11]HCZ11992.1 nicotinic acid mononucleotide adenylyltransferase [Nitrospiraceae bacterium]
MKIGILGGTFNPIHFGHLRAAEEARDKTGLDKVVFVPSGNPPLKTADTIDASHRYAMTKLATDSNVDFVVSDVELRQEEKSYTVNTIQRLREIYPEDELFFILGIDAFIDMPNWWQPDILISMTDFILVARPGFDIADAVKSPYVKAGQRAGEDFFKLKSGKKVIPLEITPLGISSTDIRRLLREGLSIKYLLPEPVERYIYGHDLYGQ